MKYLIRQDYWSSGVHLLSRFHNLFDRIFYFLVHSGSLVESHECLIKTNSLLRAQIEAKDIEMSDQSKVWEKQLKKVLNLLSKHNIQVSEL